jgi:CheY-like chemotaxis protein
MIDDDEPTNFLNRMILEEAGCAERIHIIQDAREALEYLQHAVNGTSPGNQYPRPELVFLDVNMPAMDGWEFLTELEKEALCKMTIFMLTTSFNPEDEQRAKKIKCITGYRNKPLTAEMLEEILAQYFAEYM